ncbi:hypothetical protein E4M00_14370 [Leifsonia flava]|uniref:Glycosyltransferase n=1 Tax=Orlajensenia leifsoniae TaxID=2561933 RepID=A0A4Y9QYY9_9MICO|nr:hypothetical protein E4M00_14370 [Leifsonia flava]
MAELDDDLLTDAAVDRLVSQGYDHVRLETMKRLVKFADRVIVSTPTLATSVREVNRSIVVVPNVVDPELWTRPRPMLVRESSDESLRVLYMGSWTHAGDLDLLRPVFARFIAEGRPIALETVGIADHDEGWFERLDIPAGRGNYPEFVSWLMDNRHRWDIAVAPLEDTEFNAQKSDLKFLEYTMLGLPTIASDVGPYKPMAAHGLRLARTEEDWHAALSEALGDRSVYLSQAVNAREYVEANRTLTDSHRWINAIMGRDR